MTEIVLVRQANHFIPASEIDLALIEGKIGQGEAIRCKFSKARNLAFHRKYFALMNLAFEHWNPPIDNIKYRGQPIEKNFDKFRGDITIMAGFYTSTCNIKGDVQLLPKSISFGSMNEDDFNDLYSKTIDVLIKKVMTNYSKEDVISVIDEIVEFV